MSYILHRLSLEIEVCLLEICFFKILGSVFSHWDNIVLVKLSIICSLENVMYNARQGNKIVTKIIASYKNNSSELLEEKLEEMAL